MVRAKDAPVETAKFMGHGFCDNVTKSVTLPAFTCDLAVITQTVFHIKGILNVEPKELRGIGIQISKLDTISHNDAIKKNTLKNMFEKVHAKQKQREFHVQLLNDTRTRETDHNETERRPNFRKVKSFNGTPTRDLVDKCDVKNSNKKFHKLYEELDLSVLAELPHDIQEEILREKDRVLKIDAENMGEQERRTTKKAFARKLEHDFQDNDEQERKPFIRKRLEEVSKLQTVHILSILK